MQIIITPYKQHQQQSDIKTDIMTNDHEKSPLKRVQSLHYVQSDRQNENDLQQSKVYHKNPMSMTERQIKSHDLINQIMQKHNNKTIKHIINKIDPNTQLYAKPIKGNQKQDSDQILTSHCSKKIHQIYEKISTNKSMDQKMIDIANKNIEKVRSMENKKNRPRSASFQQNLNKKVSVSGLVSYNFNSVTARKSLSFNPKGYEADFLKQEINEVNRRNACSITRKNAIIARKPGKKSLKNQALAKTGTSDFTMPTKKFLGSLLKLVQSEQEIYNQKMCKLEAIKDYMSSEKANYEDARFIVNQIAASQIQKPKPKKEIQKYVIDEQRQIRRRKIVFQRKRVMLKHLYFSDS